MSIVALALAAAAAKDPLVTFKDWTAGCDNGRSCMAVGQYNAENFDLASVVLERGPGAGDVADFWFREPDPPLVDLIADGKRLNLKFTRDKDRYDTDRVHVAAASMPALIAALKSATVIKVLGRDGKPGEILSTAGASAAMRWMDAEQHRTGTVTALVATGPKPASAVPAPPPLPTVRQVIASGPPARPFTNAQIKALQQKYADCSDDEDLQDKVDYGRLDARTTLAIVTAVCASGAYNYYGTPLLLRGTAKPVVADLGKEEGDLTMNLSWDPKTHVMSSYFKGRGLGDCGGGSDWVWDGQRFRVIEQRAMGDCLGAITWITYFRARPVPVR